MKYRKKPEIVEAVQWFNHGDHPEVLNISQEVEKYCMFCRKLRGCHGNFNGILICPGDWIVFKDDNESDVFSDTDFKNTYEPVEEPKE